MRVNFRGTEVYISFLFTLLLSFMIAFDASLTVLMCFISIILHELAHTLMLCIFKVPVRKLELQPFGIYIEHAECMLRQKEQIFVSAAGVMLNLFTALMFSLVYIFCKNQFFLKIAMINFLLFIFNFLPVNNLDGGDLLKICLTLKLGNERGCAIFRRVSFCVSAGMIICGIAVFIWLNHNPSLLIISVNLLFYCFINK